jgi:copper chaperone CopZ
MMTHRADLGLKDIGGGCACCAAPATTVTPGRAIAEVTEEILVSGMTCSHCVASVTEELTAIDGVERVDVDVNAGGASRVTIHSAAPIDAGAVKGAVEQAGYALAGRS